MVAYERVDRSFIAIQMSHNAPTVGFLLPGSSQILKEKEKFVVISFKRKIRKFHMVVHVKETAKKCTKKCDAGAKLLFYLLNLPFFGFVLFFYVLFAS